MRLSFMFLIFAIVLSGCAGSGNHPDNKILAQVGQRELKRQEVASSIPYGLASSDSLLMAEHLVKRWVKDQLVYEVALRNIDDKEAIDHLVEEYRKALVRNRYQERLVNEKVSLEVSESEKRAYYDANQDKFALNKCLIKGLFLKVPVDAPGLSDLKKWYRSTDEDDLERIEKYSVQNAAIYEFFYDKWVNFEDVLDNMPSNVPNPAAYLRSHRFTEESDSSFCYLLNIGDYLLPEGIEPYEYASARIQELLVNQRKMEFLRTFEDELYDDAVQSGEVKIFP